MRVVEVTTYGGPEVLDMVRRPEPVAGERPGRVRVRLHAAGVTITDLRIRAGLYADELSPLKPPFVLGADFAGKLLDPAPGPEGELPVGTRVAGFVPWYTERSGEGTYAEIVQVEPGWLAPVPDDVGFTQAASVPLAAITAHQGLERLGLPAGSSLLVTGASGVVGRFAVQFAAAAGLEVMAVSYEGDESELKVLGAKHCVRRGDGAEILAAAREVAPDGFDGLFDGALIGETALPAVKNGGTFIALAEDRAPVSVRDIRVETVLGKPDAVLLTKLLRQVEARELITRVADVMPLEEASEAHRRAEAGHRPGRIILMI
ncbi:zinc-binding alcohol dehydrogenase [Streptomyces laurentii]|uniref:Zinc-binding alcohol dehydrogenase n=1 Tax=Streptomyces laurentii TaxID=39478 RepID=A0A169NL39_STRLU|nr:zinc-binding alcohol dehydrogenase [Streptomyces laurentii]